MKVRKLIEELSRLDPESQVILQKDTEGNGYAPIEGVDGCAIYVVDNGDRRVYGDDWSADDACLEEDEWKRLLDGPRCAVLYPRY